MFVSTLIISALFGPKLVQIVDLMVLVPAGLLLILVSSGNSVRVDRSGLLGFGVMGLIIVYTCIAALVQSVPDTQVVFRTARALLSTLILGFAFFSLAAAGAMSIRDLLSAILAAHLVLGTVMLFQVLFPSLQPIFADVWGFDKSLRAFRAFGLTAGYDTAGYLMAFSGMLALGMFVTYRSYRYLIASFIGCTAVMFSSRSAMALLALLFVLTLARTGYARLGSLWRLWPVALGLLAAFFLYVLPLYLATFDILAGILSNVQSLGFDPATQFAETSLSLVYFSMWYLPEGFAHLLFGYAKDTQFSDIGYIKILHMGGFVLLLLNVFFLLYARNVCTFGLRHCASLQTERERVESRLLLFVLSLFLFVLMLGNLKNLYFLTRGYHELFVILTYSALGFREFFRTRTRYAMSFADKGLIRAIHAAAS